LTYIEASSVCETRLLAAATVNNKYPILVHANVASKMRVTVWKKTPIIIIIIIIIVIIFKIVIISGGGGGGGSARA
jgi:hypothetical protein